MWNYTPRVYNPWAIHIQPLCGWLSILLMEKYLSNKPKDKELGKILVTETNYTTQTL